jgi:penicillin-binding protein 1A
MPSLPDIRERVADPGSAFQMISILQGVVERGTGTRARGLGRPIGGKTGTTNDVNDVWFVGFSSDLVVGVWFGFDNPRTLGEGETGGSVAVPVFRDIMAEALKNTPVAPFRVPSSVRLVRVDPKTGLPSNAGIWEAFKPGTEPSGDRPAGTTTERGFITAPSGSVPATSQSGIY